MSTKDRPGTLPVNEYEDETVNTKGPSKQLQHLLQHPFDFVEWQC